MGLVYAMLAMALSSKSDFPDVLGYHQNHITTYLG